MNKVAVVCRGKSLAGISFLPDDIDLYVLVNKFGDELSESLYVFPELTKNRG